MRRYQLLQLRGCFIHRSRFFLQDIAYRRHAFLRLCPLVLLNGFTDRGNGLDRVSRISAGSINLVLEPWPSRQAFLAQEEPLALVKPFIECRECGSISFEAACRKVLERRIIALGRLLQGVRAVLQWSEADH